MKPGPKPTGIPQARARAMATKLASQRAARRRRNREIRRRVAGGEPTIDVACDYGLTRGMVWQITSGWQSRRTDR